MKRTLGDQHYRLVDAASYNHNKILVVGGGDSAIEAATAMANQPGNDVTLSYRKDRFFRLKSRNAERLEEYRSSKRLRVIPRSVVERVEDDRVVLELHSGSEERLFQIANDYVFVFAGGEPPFPLLHRFGIAFGADAKAAAEATA